LRHRPNIRLRSKAFRSWYADAVLSGTARPAANSSRSRCRRNSSRIHSWPDAIIATGRSDYPNQVNNVLCFPFIFRGALDVGATIINEAMKLAAVRAIAALAQEPGNDDVARACGDAAAVFGPDYLIPSPFDPRLIVRIAPAVAQAAMDSGVATLPIADMDAYRARLARMLAASGAVPNPS
jgi:malate dehydrogenase (oxaloacetate-decarboxylating)(NADP+)